MPADSSAQQVNNREFAHGLTRVHEHLDQPVFQLKMKRVSRAMIVLQRVKVLRFIPGY